MLLRHFGYVHKPHHTIDDGGKLLLWQAGDIQSNWLFVGFEDDQT